MWLWCRLETLQPEESMVLTAYQHGPSLPLTTGTPLQLGERGVAAKQECEAGSPSVQR